MCIPPRHGLASRPVTNETWFTSTFPSDDGMLVAYFCAEFGLSADIPIYAGGLGILAGDHLKAASDLGVPLVGIGLFYYDGYFRQRVDASGQHERYTERTGADLGAELLRDAEGRPLMVTVDLPTGPVSAVVWRLMVGSVTLLLLDANIPDNAPAEREITARLYGGDRETRIRQELLLGIGGLRALEAAGITPTAFHINEGHSVFLQLERLRLLIDTGATLDQAMAIVRRNSTFTTHTPVPAGNEVFTDELAARYLTHAAGAIGLSMRELADLGKVTDEPGFGLTPLALRTTARANGVRRLHGEVARAMWRGLWPNRDTAHVPIGSVTNGVHIRTWLEAGIAELVREAGVDLEHPAATGFQRATQIPDAALWRAHRANVARLVDLANARGAVAGVRPRLDPGALTIGFARRFATYKRAGLLFRDPDRLARLLSAPGAPVQVVLAGKAHPADGDGKALITTITELASDPRMAGRVVFVPDYDMAIGAHILQGTDVWLNTPRLAMEASGTSGMKAALNGALNLSILDGWWAEGYDPTIGWAIDDGSSAGDESEQDIRDHASLMELLENEVVPRFYDRGPDGVPRTWTTMMRRSIARVGSEFSAARMVGEYTERFYVPGHRQASSN
jgi:starch phosphorylase